MFREVEARRVAEQDTRIARQKILIDGYRRTGSPQLGTALALMGLIQGILETKCAQLVSPAN